MKKFPLWSVKIFSVPWNWQHGQSKHTKTNVCLHLEFTFGIQSPVSSGISFNMINICGVDPKDVHSAVAIQSVFIQLEPSLLTYFQLRICASFIKAKIVKLGSIKSSTKIYMQVLRKRPTFHRQRRPVNFKKRQHPLKIRSLSCTDMQLSMFERKMPSLAWLRYKNWHSVPYEKHFKHTF